MDTSIKKIIFVMLLTLVNHSANAYLQACQLVAEKAGKSYQVKTLRFATVVAPEDLPKNLTANLLERNGMWFIYQAEDELFSKAECASQKKHGIEILPVLFNRSSGHNAVINGVFAIKTYREKDIHLVANKHNFRKITQLPNRFTAIFDVKPQSSYDALIEQLEDDKDIEKLVPLLSEPRNRTR